jgi:hypothetical protein
MSRGASAFGGGPLLGDQTVRIVYLDEAGTSNDGEFVVVAGVIVHGDHQLTNVKSALRALTEEHLPQEDWDKPIIHTCDIYGGNKYFDEPRKPQWTASKRFALLRDLAAIIQTHRLIPVFNLVPKDRYPLERFGGKAKERLRFTVGVGYVCCLLEIDEWFQLNAKQENCFMVYEDNQDIRSHLKEAQRYNQSPRIHEDIDPEMAKLLPLKRIHEDPNFQEKRPSHPLIIADFVAFIVKRIMMCDPKALEFFEPWMGQIAGQRIQKPLQGLVQRIRAAA